MQALPEVQLASSGSTSSSGLTLVTDTNDIGAVLAADDAVDRRKLPSNRNSAPSQVEAGTGSDEGSRALSKESWTARARRQQRKRSARGPVRVGGGIKIPAGGAPAGSRLAAMVGDSEYYEQAARDPPLERGNSSSDKDDLQ